MPTILITQASEALGMKIAIRYAMDGWHVIAASNAPLDAGLTARFEGRIEARFYDPSVENSARGLAEALEGRSIDIVVLNEGVSDVDDLPPEQITSERWRPIMLANTYAPLHLASLLEPNLRRGERKILAAISSHAASLGCFDGTRGFAYRASKAALNQMWRNLSVEWKSWGCICLLLEPYGSGDLAAAQQASRREEDIAAVLKSFLFAATSEQSGKHWTRDGSLIPW